jgi:hypothetical protein
MLWLRPATPVVGHRNGDHEVAERTTFHLGGRATAVAEGGSALAWNVALDGAARVRQRAGDVFYRVEKGGPFVVSTAAGEVTVLGTCFRVEVQPMIVDRKSVVSASVGALAATTILVTVYEGRVLLANERGRTELVAGERGTAQGASAPGRVAGATAKLTSAPVVTPPPVDATRDELLQRDATQRGELAQLRARVQELEAKSLKPDGKSASFDSFFNPTNDELRDMAKNCTLRWDMPHVSLSPQTMSDKIAQELGISDEERRQFDRISAEFNQRTLAQLRALYIEVTGDKASAESLTPQALGEEITEKSPESADSDIHWRLSHERAGLIAAATDPRGGSPLERYMRFETGAGDAFERELGAAIGPDRAHALRAERGGWGWRSMSSTKCPEGR